MYHNRKAYVLSIFILMLVLVSETAGCGRRQSAALNNRMKTQDTVPADASEELPDTVDTAMDTQAEEDPEYQAFLDSKEQDSVAEEEPESSETKDFGVPDASGRVGYHCDIEADRKNFDGNADIVVGDKLYATQINDWYTNFGEYEGKTVEIEGYYIDDYAPYTFVGRYGPSCPYCNGGYVSFEFYTQEDLSGLESVKDWIKVKGILRQGEDTNGVFYYIEVLTLEKLDKVGKDTVSN